MHRRFFSVVLVLLLAAGLYAQAAAGEAPDKLAKTLVETARARAQKTGRPDDITAAVLRLEKCG